MIIKNYLNRVNNKIKIRLNKNIPLININKFLINNISYFKGFNLKKEDYLEKILNKKNIKKLGFKNLKSTKNDFSNVSGLYILEINFTKSLNKNLDKNLSEISLSKSVNI